MTITGIYVMSSGQCLAHIKPQQVLAAVCLFRRQGLSWAISKNTGQDQEEGLDDGARDPRVTLEHINLSLV